MRFESAAYKLARQYGNTTIGSDDVANHGADVSASPLSASKAWLRLMTTRQRRSVPSAYPIPANVIAITIGSMTLARYALQVPRPMGRNDRRTEENARRMRKSAAPSDGLHSKCEWLLISYLAMSKTRPIAVIVQSNRRSYSARHHHPTR